ncbi:hypothetical protein GQ43DRAFT_452286 [Delitschia confertaspora ATCC 74209]|uniref:SigF-like NTF2-like domain-containing protein n=1 Tax=Delitschia confertaspora ATCC 74209 TaxID=1513339 RepID=A0A9P4JCA4_9PLEO|nr:hypothetical protein GQ43DRAFT_452286 [Delitschia confertaspora ATCC 74209]
MENPVEEIPHVIHLLTQTSPSLQRSTISTYFTQRASFTHPFCRTGSWQHSRFLIWAIYRWYKILSPKIELHVNSVVFDESNLLLYVQLHQLFRIWFIPFYRAPVNLVTVLKLMRDKDGKYYIDSQNDLYQVDEFVKFITLPGGWVFVWVLQFLATAFCLIGAVLLWPVSAWEEFVGVGVEKTKQDMHLKD